MSTQKSIPFYEMFPFLKETNRLTADYTGAGVISASVNQPKTSMEITITLTDPVPPYEISILEDMISGEFGIKTVTVNTTYSRPSPTSNEAQRTPPASVKNPKATPSGTPSSTNKSRPIMGRATKAKPIPMGDVTVEDGKVTIKGVVIAVRSKRIEKSKAEMLNFDITDNTGTISVRKFMREEKAAKVAKAIKVGMHLIVSGELGQDKFDNELILDPINIVPYEAERRRDKAEEKRVELHLHTKMSAMDALTDIEEVIKRAVEWGHPAMAITDHGVVHTFPVAEKIVRENKYNIKIIYGMEGYLRNDPAVKDIKAEDPDSNVKPVKKDRKRRNNHVIILVKNRTGLTNLYKLVTKSHLDNYDGRPIIYKSMLKQHREGLIIGSACESGEVFKALINKLDTAELHKIAEFYDYLEIMPVCNNSFMLYEEKPKAKSEEDLRDFNRKIIELGCTLNIPVAATGDVHFLDPEHEIYRRILQKSKGFTDTNEDLPLYFKTTEEMLDEFSYLGEEAAYEVVVKNPQMIAEMCENINPLPENGLSSPKLEGSAEELERIVYEKTLELYGEKPPAIVPDRIGYEMHDILRLNYDVIYMAAQKLVAYLKEQKSRVGSRGSVGSSYVAFLAGITEVNPLPAHYRCPKCKYTEFPNDCQSCQGDGSPDTPDTPYPCGAVMPDKPCPVCGTELAKDGFEIPFETFMGFDGAKVPDIDLNISSEHQALAHKYTSDMFGAEYVFRAGTINKIQERNAYGFAKKYLESIGKIATKAEENRLALGCLGVKQTTGQHPGGLIVIPQGTEITDFCPAQHPADDSGKGVITLHFEYKFIEDNLIKLDILGHENPTMLRMLENMTGINADDIKFDDPETLSIFSSPKGLGLPEDDKIIGETGSIGIPEFGTVFTRQMLCDTRPDNFDTLIRLSGFSHGTGVWAGNAKDLIDQKTATIAETISSREDIILYLVSKGMDKKYAYFISENLRKNKGLPKSAEEEMMKHNVPKWYIESCKKITYLFPKAHAVAYIMMAFRIAWFKVHKPLEFYSAHFYRRRKNFDIELMARGIEVVRNKIRELTILTDIKSGKDAKGGKDIETLTTLESCYEFYMRGFNFAGLDLYESEAEKFKIVDEKTLRLPFITVSGLGENAAYDLVEQREKRNFISIDDILTTNPGENKTSITKSSLDKLKQLGALHDLPDSSQMSLF